MKRVAFALAATAGLAAPPAFAHDGDHPPDLSVWAAADGREFVASFVLARGDRALFADPGGAPRWVPLADLAPADREWVQNHAAAVRRLNGVPDGAPAPAAAGESILPLAAVLALVGLAAAGNALRRWPRVLPYAGAGVALAAVGLFAAAAADPPAPAALKHFEPFQPRVKARADGEFLYVESDGMPDHRMMVGITAWQQQVPIPQAYTGANAWRIPLNPKIADKPVSAKTALFRGAIALAVNGVPIFNPIKNDGRTDTFLAGELDEFGGHCGRADDYHYHTAPVHLEKIVGKGNPIGYALDGYPLYGFTDAAGKEPKDLDEFNGRAEPGGYRYYSTRAYPYMNGGLRGVVTVRDDQVDPQPRAYSPRAALTPLRGAKITGFEQDAATKSATVKYDLRGQTHSVRYTPTPAGYTFVFTDGAGKQTTESYAARPDGKRPPPKKDDTPRPKKDDTPPKKTGGPPKKEDAPPPPGSGDAPPPKPRGGFTLTSPAFAPGGPIPAEFTGDGAGVSPPLAWSGAPAGTKSFALQVWHKPRPDGDEVKSYWVVTHIPATAAGLEKNSTGVGRVGLNDKRRAGYDPMNSKGPGAKAYHITLYALSAEPKFDTDRVTRADLLRAVKDTTLAETTLSYTHERKGKP